MKLHLLLPVKWKTLDGRVHQLSQKLSTTSHLGAIYGHIDITYSIVTLPNLTLNKEGVYNKSDILKITKPYHTDYDAVGIVFPFTKGEKYAGNYYPNDGTDYKMDFYIKANEKTKEGSGYAFEEFIEHEMAHAVALDLGLSGQGIDTGHRVGADNTHFYFYGKNKEGFYKEVQEAWKKKFGILSQMLKATSLLVDMLKKKLWIKPLESKYWNNVSQHYGVKNPIYSITGHHIGTDFACPIGTPIYARCDGEITQSYWHGQLGYFIYFKFDKYEERYCHLKKMGIEGKVKKGDIIGYTGNTGMSTGSHLHIDTHLGSVQKITKSNWRERTVDPLSI
jgi:hypothetical protein